MIAWICEHIPNDEDLYLTLHGHFGMTKDELHEHCIDSLDRFFPEENTEQCQDGISQVPDDEPIMTM